MLNLLKDAQSDDEIFDSIRRGLRRLGVPYQHLVMSRVELAWATFIYILNFPTPFMDAIDLRKRARSSRALLSNEIPAAKHYKQASPTASTAK